MCVWVRCLYSYISLKSHTRPIRLQSDDEDDHSAIFQAFCVVPKYDWLYGPVNVHLQLIWISAQKTDFISVVREFYLFVDKVWSKQEDEAG